MLDFSAFLAQNKIKSENVKYVASKNFVSNGEPMEWEIQCIDCDKDEALRKACTKQIKVMGKSNQYRSELDTNAYIAQLCAHSIVFPDLNNKELQDSYGVMGAPALLKKMLTPGEFADLAGKVSEVNGFDTGLGELVDEAKN